MQLGSPKRVYSSLSVECVCVPFRGWRKRENPSQSEAGLRLQISKRTLQEWEQGQAAPHNLAGRGRERHSLVARWPRGIPKFHLSIEPAGGEGSAIGRKGEA
jgi:hypothetical protein